ncbi:MULTISPECIES: TetR/AcrR family transcriptional regulator [Cryobacterium]|uniref:TetR/AcrR family transcriptional regulator n=1 Tax=Cryobacterium glucosi TaxID=1259175 RepID=A0ABY2IN58_9MICO|nr:MULTISPECIES: TetR/AcrR family transcriptional regulator [Cryobacterium]TFC01292.1 TetR/AcrR family transcriptional regulator [Cryobacterium sp. MDB2-A-1]TFC09111.1 TetR/AcrR family transcriptional regulator [Cryobacterium sp. MDB2-A-2]TFC09221.1 TetR/AcrR family transcriptional regulator [Cryobacterium sp. MDB2-33-2]TFC13075.1 TetR/AcrR family transcriptional regulator [Cryobacterium sp. MDB2-10]TFC19964.1 TetR/AcrR family transcriptional regulator [Cryobacterium glucosi]
MVDVAEEPGLRERKRLATHRAIQLAVLTLASERGVDKVTVEDISRIADVSPRTFFNYFPSKDAALAGDDLTLGSEAEIEDFVHRSPSGDILADLAVLLSTSVQNSQDDREIHHLRRQVMKENPYLFGMRMATLRSFEGHLDDVISRRLAADDPVLAADPIALHQRALLLTLVAVAALRHAWRCWAEGDESEPLADRVRASFAGLYELTLRTS